MDLKKVAENLTRAREALEKRLERKGYIGVGDYLVEIERESTRGKYVVWTGICGVGGCSIYPEFFPDLGEAILYALSLVKQGKKPAIGVCEECYREGLNSEGVYAPVDVRYQQELRRLQASKGSGERFDVVLEIRKMECRPFYDSLWEIRVLTSRGTIESIRITRMAEETEENLLNKIIECTTIGDLRALDQSGLIYYD
ncbi:MAG: hypothetical protein ACPLQP_01160 [Moorellaceae bacterium]